LIVTYTEKQIDGIWSRVVPFIERALERGSIWNIEDIYDGLKESTFQLWAWKDDGIEAVLITCLVKDKYCVMLTMAGSKMYEWIKFLPIVENWARQNGCKEMMVHGRKGWSRVLKYPIVRMDELGLYVMEKQL